MFHVKTVVVSILTKGSIRLDSAFGTNGQVILVQDTMGLPRGQMGQVTDMWVDEKDNKGH